MGLSPLEGCLRFVRNFHGIEAVLCGVVSQQELAEVLHAWRKMEDSSPKSMVEWAWEDIADLDPRLWPQR